MTDEKKLSILGDMQQVLKYTFTVLPIVAGLDKFFNLLANWEIYVPVWIGKILPPETIMIIVGIIEIIAGLIVLTKTKVGAYIVSIWLLAITVVLVTGGHYLDIALRDLVMAITAFVLARMTSALMMICIIQTPRNRKHKQHKLTVTYKLAPRRFGVTRAVLTITL